MLVAILIPLLAETAARALTLSPLFDSSVTSLPNAAQVEAAVDYAIGQIDAMYADPITIKFLVSASALGPHLLGEATPDLDGPYTYATVRTA